MDVIYPYRATARHDELRFSLRSLVNMPHDRVFVAGDDPGFRVNCVPVPRHGNRYQSSTLNICAAADLASDSFVVMHDDMFILRPWKWRHEHRCSIEEYLRDGNPSGTYRGHVKATRDILAGLGIHDPLFFGLHTPTIYERKKLLDLVKEFRGKAYLLRTLYHNIYAQPSVRRDDVKLRDWNEPPEGQDILSISDGLAVADGFNRFIQERFPEPSPYER